MTNVAEGAVPTVEAPPPIAPTTPLVSTDAADRLRLTALWMIWGGAIILTLSTFVSLWFVRESPTHVFWLALAAHANVFVILSAAGGLLVKRNLEINREGISLNDREEIADSK